MIDDECCERDERCEYAQHHEYLIQDELQRLIRLPSSEMQRRLKLTLSCLLQSNQHLTLPLRAPLQRSYQLAFDRHSTNGVPYYLRPRSHRR